MKKIDLNNILRSALENQKAGRFKEAEAGYLSALKRQPDNPIALEFLGDIYVQTERNTEAKEVLLRLKQGGKASIESQINLARALLSLADFDEAEILLKEIIHKDSNSAIANYLLGLACMGKKNYPEAITAYDRSIQLDPHNLRAIEFLGKVLSEMGRHQEAIEQFDKVIDLNPNSKQIHMNRGVSHAKCENWPAASQDFMEVIQDNPQNAGANINLGNCLSQMKLFQHAISAYRRAMMIDPTRTGLMSTIVRNRHQSCDWSHYTEDNQYLTDLIIQEQTTENPFAFLNISESAAEQLICANSWVKHHYTLPQTPPTFAPSIKQKIRLAYVSSDYYTHATAILAEQLFKAHDRSKFEVIAISLDTLHNDSTTDRLRGHFDAYHEMAGLPTQEITEKITALDIDILIDLKGYTKDARTDIFVSHPAPVQVNYLGFPGTMGHGMMDYIIADPVLIPKGYEPFYSEKIVKLPSSYQINDNQRPIAEDSGTRADHGLPEQGFVFCCFNNNYKITPSVFGIWMRLLLQVPGSVLWLFQDNEAAAQNLRQEAARRGVDPERLIFAGRLPTAQHLARHRHADLFLDTRPYNAHTTASDALWTGLPVLTCPGQAFAARVAASLLRAAGLPELVTQDYTEYERLALELATQPDRLAQIKDKLERQRLTCDLFNTGKTTRALEAAYEAMHARRQAGLPPEHIEVDLPG